MQLYIIKPNFLTLSVSHHEFSNLMKNMIN